MKKVKKSKEKPKKDVAETDFEPDIFQDMGGDKVIAVLAN
jgi:hypothetical protein